MKMTWKKFFYILLGLAVLVLLGFLYILYLVNAVPQKYGQELKIPPSMHQQSAQELLDTVDDIKESIRWGDDLNYEITQQQINGWLATQLNGNPHVSLPDGIRNPRILIDQPQQTLYFTLERSRFTSAISIQLTIKLAEQPNTIEIKLNSLHAGNLPIRIKRVFDEIESAMARSGVDFKWKPGTDRTVAIVRIPTVVRIKRERELDITSLEFLKEKVRVQVAID